MLSRKRYRHRLWIDQVDRRFRALRSAAGGSVGARARCSATGTLAGASPCSRPPRRRCSSACRTQVGQAMLVKHCEGLRLARHQRRCVDRRGGGRRPNPVTEGLRELGLWGLGAHEKFIPAAFTARPTASPRLDAAAGPARHRRLGREMGLRPLLHLELSAGEGCGGAGPLAGRLVHAQRQAHRATRISGENDARGGRPSSLNIHHPRSPLALPARRTSAIACPRSTQRAWKPVIASIVPTPGHGHAVHLGIASVEASTSRTTTSSRTTPRSPSTSPSTWASR